MHRLPTLLLACSSALVIATAFGAQTAPTNSLALSNSPGSREIDMAANHAEHAVQGETVKEVHSHLHHVINCLVGPGGKYYDAQEENPCSGLGRGALNDVTQHSDEQRSLMDALDAAHDGLEKANLKSANKEAKSVLNDLEKAQASYAGPGATGAPSDTTHR